MTEGLRNQRRAIRWLRRTFPAAVITAASTLAPFDVVLNGKRMEIKSATFRTGNRCWSYSIHRHGVLDETQVDWYLFNTKNGPIPYVLLKAPLGGKTKHISLWALKRRGPALMAFLRDTIDSWPKSDFLPRNWNRRTTMLPHLSKKDRLRQWQRLREFHRRLGTIRILGAALKMSKGTVGLQLSGHSVIGHTTVRAMDSLDKELAKADGRRNRKRAVKVTASRINEVNLKVRQQGVEYGARVRRRRK